MACSASTNQNTIIHTGDDARLVVNFTGCDGAPVDVTGSTLTYTIHACPTTDALITLVSPSQIVIADDGQSAAILLTPTNTNYVDKGYFHKLVLEDGAGNTLTILTGFIRFSAQSITCCDALTARVDTDLLAQDSFAFSLDFSSANHSQYLWMFFDEVI